jgi:hypothetical protein
VVLPPPVRTSAAPCGAPSCGVGKSAIPGGPCCNRADVERARAPYVLYAEGPIEDVATFKLGYVVVTVRPASALRITRTREGGLHLDNVGTCLVLVVLDDNQFAFIGCHGSLVLSPDGQVECFRGLVHLYRRRPPPCFMPPPPRQKVTPERPEEHVPFGGR